MQRPGLIRWPASIAQAGPPCVLLRCGGNGGMGEIMNTTAKVLLAAAGALAVCGYALGQDAEATFKKRGASIAAQKRDSGQCWKIAGKTKLTEEQATQNVITGYL